MKQLQALVAFLQKIIAKEFIWTIIALVLSVPLGLILLHVLDLFVSDNNQFLIQIDGEIEILYFLFVLLSFCGILLIRFISSSIITLLSPPKEGEE